MKKPITWLRLWKRIGKQPISRTQGKYVKLKINGCVYEVDLVFENNGSSFYLELVRMIKNMRE